MTYPPHIFADNPINRGEAERRDEDWILQQAEDPASKFLPFRSLNVLLTDQTPPELGWLSPAILRSLPPEAEWIFLGLLDDVGHFSIDLSKSANTADRVERRDRLAFRGLPHRRRDHVGPQHRPAVPRPGAAGLEPAPRVLLGVRPPHRQEARRPDAPVLRLQRPALSRAPTRWSSPSSPTWNATAACLGQSRGRLQRMRAYSALAGFMDQGEAIEEAVAREVMEEAGIRVKNVRYHSSQPWPFPSSLMIGCLAEADTTDINMDDEEMTDVRWFDRSEVLLALEGRSEELTVPGPIAIAHHLIKAWATGASTG